MSWFQQLCFVFQPSIFNLDKYKRIMQQHANTTTDTTPTLEQKPFVTSPDELHDDLVSTALGLLPDKLPHDDEMLSPLSAHDRPHGDGGHVSPVDIKRERKPLITSKPSPSELRNVLNGNTMYGIARRGNPVSEQSDDDDLDSHSYRNSDAHSAQQLTSPAGASRSPAVDADPVKDRDVKPPQPHQSKSKLKRSRSKDLITAASNSKANRAASKDKKAGPSPVNGAFKSPPPFVSPRSRAKEQPAKRKTPAASATSHKNKKEKSKAIVLDDDDMLSSDDDQTTLQASSFHEKNYTAELHLPSDSKHNQKGNVNTAESKKAKTKTSKLTLANMNTSIDLNHILKDMATPEILSPVPSGTNLAEAHGRSAGARLSRKTGSSENLQRLKSHTASSPLSRWRSGDAARAHDSAAKHDLTSSVPPAESASFRASRQLSLDDDARVTSPAAQSRNHAAPSSVIEAKNVKFHNGVPSITVSINLAAVEDVLRTFRHQSGSVSRSALANTGDSRHNDKNIFKDFERDFKLPVHLDNHKSPHTRVAPGADAIDSKCVQQTSRASNANDVPMDESKPDAAHLTMPDYSDLTGNEKIHLPSMRIPKKQRPDRLPIDEDRGGGGGRRESTKRRPPSDSRERLERKRRRPDDGRSPSVRSPWLRDDVNYEHSPRADGRASPLHDDVDARSQEPDELSDRE